MLIAIESASPAVTRTLREVIAMAGLAQECDVTRLTIIDRFHPQPSAANHSARLLLETRVRPSELAHVIHLALANQPQLALADGWQLMAATRQLTHAELAPVILTEKECVLLSVLARDYPLAIAREALLQEVWAYDEAAETHTLETHIYRLRAKLNALHPKPCDILTVEGAYRLVKA